jgi:tRNA-specific adenosine deaminase 3
VTVRDEELPIFYGHTLWFDPAEFSVHLKLTTMAQEEAEDGWGGLLAVDEAVQSTKTNGPFLEGDPNEIIPDEKLPFVRFKLPPEEEDPESIRTGVFPK